MKNLNVILCLVLLLGATSLNATTLDRAQKELFIKSAETGAKDLGKKTKFSTVEINQSFLNKDSLNNQAVGLAVFNQSVANGLLGETNTEANFGSLNSLQVKYIANLIPNLRYFVEGSYGVSQAKTSLLETDTEKVNLNQFQLGLGVEFSFYKYSGFDFVSDLTLKQNFLVQVSESGLHDQRTDFAMGQVGLGFYTPSFLSDSTRVKVQYLQSLGSNLNYALVSDTAIKIEAEIQL